MLELSPAGRAGTPDEVATVAALLMGSDGAFITGSDFLMDGGVTASYFYGELAPQVTAHSGRLPVHDTNSHGLEAALMASNAERTTTATIITVNDRPPASSPNTNGSADPADGVVQRSSQHEIVHLDRHRDMPPSRPSPRT